MRDGRIIKEARRQRVLALARAGGALGALERVACWREVRRQRAPNARFSAKHSDRPMPPPRWMHDMYAHASFDRYWRSGAADARVIADALSARTGKDRLRVAEWGCGMGRITRHLEADHDVSGYDYNPAAIAWCAKHLSGRYAVNGLMPPLPADDAAFDALFAVSVLTHLSAKAHEAWAAEVARVLRPGGVALLTVHGAPGPGQLLPAERAAFDAGRLVMRGRVTEGRRPFVAFQPDPFMRALLTRAGLKADGPHDIGLRQVAWFARRA